ncbi:helix-turn-helix domain-containing protein [Microbacterium sp. ASV49]|uniref:Helix-turn-helix domain-containing protein n=1 Tax=Microbacterium candidum TaxID=3041922 RepID=A0ABT7N1B7_9MICO|nr:helix-turn-helix domain-containing protein [Microbacterium sp. ASV49]MDL9980500.1 helix-turn-helix domain-containing protein [Microbacterium sp. ASV49]
MIDDRPLDAMGLDGGHAVVYRRLLAAPAASAAELAAETALSPGSVGQILDELELAGFVARQASSPHRFVASPPSLVMRPLLVEQERRLAAAHETLVELSAVYREGAALRAVPDVVDVVVGADAVRQRLGQLQAAATERVDVFVLSDVALVASDDNLEEERALARGVRYRTIVETGVLERAGFMDAAKQAALDGEEVRVLPALPTRLFIADGDIALLPMASHGPGQADGALLLHKSGLLDLVDATFETSWRAARPLFAEEGRDSAEDRELLSLLMIGLTDAAAAAQLGISLRTIQRRVSELIELAGVSSRFQLGAEAVRRGWL